MTPAVNTASQYAQNLYQTTVGAVQNLTEGKDVSAIAKDLGRSAAKAALIGTIVLSVSYPIAWAVTNAPLTFAAAAGIGSRFDFFELADKVREVFSKVTQTQIFTAVGVGIITAYALPITMSTLLAGTIGLTMGAIGSGMYSAFQEQNDETKASPIVLSQPDQDAQVVDLADGNAV